MRQSSRFHHRVQVARARQYLRDHATEDVDLAAVAKVAGASPYHFARLYHAVTGETVFGTVTRLRVARGAARLCETPARSISQAALEAGYATPSAFNKAFRAVLGMTPTELRALPAAARRACLDGLEASPATRQPPELPLSHQPTLQRRGTDRVVYVRERGSYDDIAAPLAWSRLAACLTGSSVYDRFLRVGATHDDPRQVAAKALRYDAGVIVDVTTPVPRGASVALWPGGPHAVFEFRGPYELIAAAFGAIFRNWVATARLVLRAAPCLELYSSPASTPERNLLTELWLPVEESHEA